MQTRIQLISRTDHQRLATISVPSEPKCINDNCTISDYGLRPFYQSKILSLAAWQLQAMVSHPSHVVHLSDLDGRLRVITVTAQESSTRRL